MRLLSCSPVWGWVGFVQGSLGCFSARWRESDIKALEAAVAAHRALEAAVAALHGTVPCHLVLYYALLLYFTTPSCTVLCFTTLLYYLTAPYCATLDLTRGRKKKEEDMKAFEAADARHLLGRQVLQPVHLRTHSVVREHICLVVNSYSLFCVGRWLEHSSFSGWICGLGLRVHGFGVRVEGWGMAPELRALGFRVQGSGFRV